jgi:hypothetical protein
MFGFAGLLASACLSAYPQVTTLTGAMQFSTNSSGAYFGGQAWNTLGGDQSWDLWLAQNPDGSSPINGPTDELSGINLPLLVGHKYQFYVFGAPAASISLNGLNLFFGGNDSTPGISVFGATNSSVFVPNISSSTRTLAGALVTGSGRSFYASNGVVVVLPLRPATCAKPLPSPRAAALLSPDLFRSRFGRRRPLVLARLAGRRTPSSLRAGADSSPMRRSRFSANKSALRRSPQPLQMVPAPSRPPSASRSMRSARWMCTQSE